MKFKEKSFIREVKERWVSESPVFWIKIKKRCIENGIVYIGIIITDKIFDLQNLYNLSSSFITICRYMLAVCFGLGLGAKLAKK